MKSSLERIADLSALGSQRLNWLVERFCAVLLVVLVLDVWLGVFVRYVLPLPITFTEEAVSCMSHCQFLLHMLLRLLGLNLSGL